MNVMHITVILSVPIHTFFIYSQDTVNDTFWSQLETVSSNHLVKI